MADQSNTTNPSAAPAGMVERVARAIFNHFFAEHERSIWDTDLELRARYLDNARAAIEAMREPTEAMSDVGGKCTFPSGEYNYSLGSIADEVWQTMIDAALKDSDHG